MLAFRGTQPDDQLEQEYVADTANAGFTRTPFAGSALAWLPRVPLPQTGFGSPNFHLHDR